MALVLMPALVLVGGQVSTALYSEERLLSYRGRDSSTLPPHIYAVAEAAYRQLLDGVVGHADSVGSSVARGPIRGNYDPQARNQSILVSGESGAGKTESVKIMMSYIAAVSSTGVQNEVSTQVFVCHPSSFH